MADHVTARDVPRTAVVTGGASGLGLATATELLRRGHRVVVVARDAARGAAACAQLASAGGDVELVVGDLSDVASTRAAASALERSCPRIDVLVHNAGVWPDRLRRDAAGLELAFRVNHLAPFALNALLEPHLRASGARVVQVSAGLYVKGRAAVGRTATGADFSPVRTYADTKLCNLMTVPLWARRWEASGVTIDAVHPGVLRTALGDRPGPLGAVLRLAKRTWSPVEDGARAVADVAATTGATGRYLEVAEVKPLVAPADDPGLAAALWDEAARLTGVPS